MMAVEWKNIFGVTLRGPVLMCSQSHVLSWSVWRGRDLQQGTPSLRSSQPLLGMGLRVLEMGSVRGRQWGPWGPTGQSQLVWGGSSERC